MFLGREESKGFIRIDEILKLIPISRSTWWNGVKIGKFPKSIKLGPKTTAWKRADINDLIASLENGASNES